MKGNFDVMNIIQADTIKNLLLWKLEGDLSDEDTRYYSRQALFEAKKLKKGFTLIEDVSALKASSSHEGDIDQTKNLICKMGIGKLIRIVNQNFHSGQTGEEAHDYQLNVVTSMGEAVRLI